MQLLAKGKVRSIIQLAIMQDFATNLERGMMWWSRSVDEEVHTSGTST